MTFGHTPVEGMHVEYMWHVHDNGYDLLSGPDSAGRTITIEPWTMTARGWLGRSLDVSITGQMVRADGGLVRQHRTHSYRERGTGEWGVRSLDDLPEWAKPRLAEALARHERTDVSS